MHLKCGVILSSCVKKLSLKVPVKEFLRQYSTNL